MRELVTILDSALAAGLSKRQWAVFAVVLRQTLGYRKVVDDLSSGRLAQLTGIQRNHVWQAKQELVDMGLLVSTPGKFGEVLGFTVLHVSIHAPSEANLEGIIPRPNEFYPPRKGASKPELVLHEKLSGGFAAYPSPSPLPATDSGYAMQQSATDSGWPVGQALSATDSGHREAGFVTVSVHATDSGCASAGGGGAAGVLHEKPAFAPDLGEGTSQIGPESVPKQDTSLSNHTNSNHDNGQGGGVVSAEVVLPDRNAGVSATDSGHDQLSEVDSRLSATDSGLEWPAGLPDGMRREIGGVLCGLSVPDTQLVLDILAMGLEAGTVRKPVAYVRALVRSSHRGELVMAGVQAWREERKRKQAKAVPLERLERVGELAWLQQIAGLQGLPVGVVAAQLGIKIRPPCQVDRRSMAAAGDTPAPAWMDKDRCTDPPVECGGTGSVSP